MPQQTNKDKGNHKEDNHDKDNHKKDNNDKDNRSKHKHNKYNHIKDAHNKAILFRTFKKVECSAVFRILLPGILKVK